MVAALRSLPHPRLEAATEAFTRDHKATSNVALAAIPLQQLVSGGYLRAEEIRGLQHRDATVSLASRDAMLIPHTIWVRVRATDGSDIVLMVDGSVQKMPTR
ncbi:MAG: hypothetical protein L0Y58_13725 [Verrucomicrobia subdivision 3 bacterium]|nr:hypothetical protein [Limisphaerales bacterium]